MDCSQTGRVKLEAGLEWPINKLPLHKRKNAEGNNCVVQHLPRRDKHVWREAIMKESSPTRQQASLVAIVAGLHVDDIPELFTQVLRCNDVIKSDT